MPKTRKKKSITAAWPAFRAVVDSSAPEGPVSTISNDELSRELNALRQTWEVIKALDTQQRERVLTWLAAITRYEAHGGGHY